VFAPAQAHALPVMVWIHGGGFVNGSGTAKLYDGTALARQGVVVVTLNYRLGRLGFFAHPALTAEANGAPAGNYALMDIIQALNWVRDNARAFGGDPRRVTIFGESAGGIAVNNLMVSPAARGLFTAAISQSGLGREQTPSLAEAEKFGVQFAAKVGAPNATAADLRHLSAEQIVMAGDPDLRRGEGAMLDGKVLTVNPMQGFARGSEASVPYLVGFNSLEFPVSEGLLEPILASAVKASDRQRLEAAYGSKTDFSAHAVSDILFNEPGLSLAKMHAEHGRPTWVYQFSVVSSSMRGKLQGTPHASERKYVFRTLSTSPWPTDENDERQSALVSAYWTSFAKSRNPNGGQRPDWLAYDPAQGQIMDFTNDGPIAVKTPRQKAIEVLRAIAEAGR
jgi:para-nitrobenzyl esterase